MLYWHGMCAVLKLFICDLTQLRRDFQFNIKLLLTVWLHKICKEIRRD